SGSILRPFEATSDYVAFLGELSFSTFKDLGSDRILLVEGVHDVKALQQLLRLIEIEHTTVILPLGGNQMITRGRDAELAELRCLSNSSFALIDSERTDASLAVASDRLAFAEGCRGLGIQCLVTQRRALENYFSARAISSALGASHQALTEYQHL